MTKLDYHLMLREDMKWGGYGKEGDQPLKYKKVCELSNDHIRAILDTQQLGEVWRDVLNYELAYRSGQGIVIED